MSVIRFDTNVSIEVALKFDAGKQAKSRIPEAPDQMMYTLCGDDTIYVPLHVADMITKLGIRKMELISICKRHQNGVTRWEVKRAGDATTTALQSVAKPEAPTMLEKQLTRSIEEVKAQRALPTPAAPQSTTLNGTQTTPNSNPAPIAHTIVSRIMASALIAAFDATQECERCAHTKGVELEFGPEDVRAISNTLFIQISKDPAFAAVTQKVNGGAQPWQQQ
jgi:hypothetical protein